MVCFSHSSGESERRSSISFSSSFGKSCAVKIGCNGSHKLVMGSRGAGVPPAVLNAGVSTDIMDPLPPGPHPRPVLQACLGRILRDIAQGPVKFRLVTNQVIVILALPKFTAPPKYLICSLRGIGFPRVKDSTKRCAANRLEKRVDMIRRH